MEFFCARDRKPNLSLLRKKKKKKHLLDAVAGKCTGSSGFRPGFIQGIHIKPPGPGFSLLHASLPVPLVWLHPQTHPSLMATRWLQQRCICSESQKSFSGRLCLEKSWSHFDFLPDLYDFLSSASFEFNLLFFS